MGGYFIQYYPSNIKTVAVDFEIRVTQNFEAMARDEQGARGGMRNMKSLGTLLFIGSVQCLVMMCWCICHHHSGDYTSFINRAQDVGALQYYKSFWPYPFDNQAMLLISSFVIFEAFLMEALPGRRIEADRSKTGHLPIYCANGVACYLISLAVLCYMLYYDDYYFFADTYFGIIGDMLSCLNVAAMGLCIILMIKGYHFPSSKDCDSTGSICVDFFRGIELHPRLLNWDIKQFVQCRFGMLFSQISVIICAFQQFKKEGWISSSLMICTVLQSLRILKFFWWETEYIVSRRVQNDRMGYYNCWYSLVWLPAVHTLPTYYLVNKVVLLSPFVTAVSLCMGMLSIWYKDESES